MSYIVTEKCIVLDVSSISTSQRAYVKMKLGCELTEDGMRIPLHKERELKKILAMFEEKSKKISEMKSDVKSRKNQKKYHRSVSEDESDDIMYKKSDYLHYASSSSSGSDDDENVYSSSSSSSNGFPSPTPDKSYLFQNNEEKLRFLENQMTNLKREMLTLKKSVCSSTKNDDYEDDDCDESNDSVDE